MHAKARRVSQAARFCADCLGSPANGQLISGASIRAHRVNLSAAQPSAADRPALWLATTQPLVDHDRRIERDCVAFARNGQSAMFPRLIPGPVRYCLNSLHHYGRRITLRDSMPYLRELVFGTERQLERTEDFDARFATDTASSVWPWDLPCIRASGRDVRGYEAVQGVREALRRLLLESFAVTFGDLGRVRGALCLSPRSLRWPISLGSSFRPSFTP
jgi:hypothetical protein